MKCTLACGARKEGEGHIQVTPGTPKKTTDTDVGGGEHRLTSGRTHLEALEVDNPALVPLAAVVAGDYFISESQ